MNTSPSIVAIAQAAGVGKSTAARVLAGYGAVSETTREKVLDVARAMRYRANTAARALRKGENRLLGVVVPDSASRGTLSHIIQSQKLDGIAHAAKRLGYDLQIFLEDLQDEAAFRRLAEEKFVRGVFFLHRVPPATLELMERYRIPWIGVNWRYPDRAISPHCWTDFEHAGRSLCGHLIACGCRRVVAFDWLSPEYGPFAEGVRAAWKANRLPRRNLTVHTGSDLNFGPRFESLLAQALAADPQPDGVLVTHEMGALAAYRLLRARKREAGRDVAVATFDDLQAAQHLDPPCTALAQPTFAMGEAAVEEMDRQLAGGAPRTIVRALPGELTVRDSTRRFLPRAARN